MKYKVLYKGNLYKFSRVNVIQTTFSDLNIILTILDEHCELEKRTNGKSI